MEKIEFTRMMESRTKAAAISIIKLVDSFPNKTVYWEFGKQLIKSATSTAANYRAANRGRSGKEFFAKLSISIEECDETVFWLETLREGDLISSEIILPHEKEFTELLKILAKSRKTLSEKQNNKA